MLVSFAFKTSLNEGPNLIYPQDEARKDFHECTSFLKQKLANYLNKCKGCQECLKEKLRILTKFSGDLNSKGLSLLIFFHELQIRGESCPHVKYFSLSGPS